MYPDGKIQTEVAKYQRGWRSGLPETECGAGSTLARTKAQREWLADVVKRHGVKSVVDVGAGDLNWIGHVDWDVDYQAFDLVPRHPSVKHMDIIHDVPPQADLLMCLWVLNHLPEAHQDAAAANIAASGCKYIIYTYWPAMLARMDWGADESIVINDEKQAELRFIHADSLVSLLG